MIPRVLHPWMARWRPGRPGLTSRIWYPALALVYWPCSAPTLAHARSGNSVEVPLPGGRTPALEGACLLSFSSSASFLTFMEPR